MTRSHTARRIAGVASAALALGIAAPAGARPYDINQVGSMVPAGSTQSPAPAVQPNPDQQVSQSEQPAVSSSTGGNPRPVQYTAHTPFDWGDAAVGAAGGVGISLLIVGGVVVTVGRRRQSEVSSRAAIAG